MFLLRPVAESDLNDLYNLANQVTFINLPADRSIIKGLISSSKLSFQKSYKDLSKNFFFFVLEDLVHKKVIGTSMIHSQHGSKKSPHYFLTVGQENKFCKTINTGFIHGTLKLGIDTDGPTEIGALVLDPQYRGHADKLGKQLSFVRFMYMAHYPEKFKADIHAELMPPLDKDGNSPLWEAIGRRFLNMSYHEADKLSRSNKEFILNLFPEEIIYETLLPMEARNAIGKVGKDTEPVKKMLENIGFRYTNEVDPFDGGPHYRCRLSKISLVENYSTGSVELTSSWDEDEAQTILMEIPYEDYNYAAVQVQANLVKSKKKKNEYRILLDAKNSAIKHFRPLHISKKSNFIFMT